MKTKINVITNTWLGIVSVLGVLIAPMEHVSAQSDQHLIEVARSVVTADRETVVVAAMELTDAESKNFWPLYHEYRSAMEKINDELIDLAMLYAQLYPDIPQSQAKQLLKTYTTLQEKHVVQRTSYLKRFGKVLPAAKALRFAQVETRLDLLDQLNLASKIPLTPIDQAK